MANADLLEHHSSVASYQKMPCQLLDLIVQYLVSSSELICPAFDLWLIKASVRLFFSAGGSRRPAKRTPRSACAVRRKKREAGNLRAEEICSRQPKRVRSTTKMRLLPGLRKRKNKSETGCWWMLLLRTAMFNFMTGDVLFRCLTSGDSTSTPAEIREEEKRKGEKDERKRKKPS